jgi:hypothetical protein
MLSGIPFLTPAQAADMPPQAMADMGTPAATFVFLPQIGIADQGSATGSTGGTGTISFNGKRYGFTAAGVSAGQIGSSPGPITGEIYHLSKITDLNGGYTADMMSGGKEAILKNQKGVAIHLLAQSGLGMSQTIGVRLN